MNAETKRFVAQLLPKHVEAERQIHAGDAQPRMDLWSRNDPVTVLGAKESGQGWAQLEPMFKTVAGWFSDPSRTSSSWSRPARAATWPTRSATSKRGRRRRHEADLHAACHTRLPARGRRVAHGPPPRRLPARGRHEAIRRGVTAGRAQNAGRCTMSDTLPPFLATDPEVYEHFMGRWSARLADPFLEFAGIEPGSTVLDVGCGTGTMTLALAKRGAKTVGLDASESYLDGARRFAHPDIDTARRRMRPADTQRIVRCLRLSPRHRRHPRTRSGRHRDAASHPSRRSRRLRDIRFLGWELRARPRAGHRRGA